VDARYKGCIVVGGISKAEDDDIKQNLLFLVSLLGVANRWTPVSRPPSMRYNIDLVFERAVSRDLRVSFLQSGVKEPLKRRVQTALIAI
jgi:hypothetical protein